MEATPFINQSTHPALERSSRRRRSFDGRRLNWINKRFVLQQPTSARFSRPQVELSKQQNRLSLRSPAAIRFKSRNGGKVASFNGRLIIFSAGKEKQKRKRLSCLNNANDC